MTQEMQDILNAQLDSAATPEDVSRAMVTAMKALIDCQRKTAERVKALAIERDRAQARRDGARWLWGVLATIAASGGGALVLKLLSSIQL